MKELKRLITTTGIYFLGTVGTKLISFLLLPLYTAYIIPSQYGQYDVNINYALLFASICFLDIWTGIMKFMFEYKEKKQQESVVYAGLMIFFVSSVIYVIFISLFEWVMKIEYPLGVTFYGFFLCLQNLYGYLARAYGKNILFAISGMISTACNAGLNIFLLIVCKWDYRALYLSYAVGILVQCIILEMKLNIRKSIQKNYINRQIIKELLCFSLPLCINSLCYWLLTGYNRVVIEKETSTVMNGYFAVAAKFGGVLILATSCFSMAWQELAYHKYEKDNDTGQFYTSATNLYIKVLFGGFFILIPVIYGVFPYLINENYAQAKVLIPLNMLATLAGTLFTFLGNIISTYKKNNIIFLSTLAACITNITVVHLLIGKIGVEAANIALLAGYMVSNAIRIKIIAKEIHYHLDWKMFIYLIPFTGIVLLGYWKGQWADNIILLILGVIVFVWNIIPFTQLRTV